MLSPGLPTAKTLLAVRDGLSKRTGPVWHTISYNCSSLPEISGKNWPCSNFAMKNLNVLSHHYPPKKNHLHSKGWNQRPRHKIGKADLRGCRLEEWLVHGHDGIHLSLEICRWVQDAFGPVLGQRKWDFYGFLMISWDCFLSNAAIWRIGFPSSICDHAKRFIGWKWRSESKTRAAILK